MQNNHIEQIASINYCALQITGMQIIDLLRGGPQNGGGTRKDISAKRGGFPPQKLVIECMRNHEKGHFS